MGTGLGLSIFCGIVRQHGGEVSVKNRPGGGAVFTMELPSAASPAMSDKPYLIGSSAGAERQAVLGQAHNARILIVEDEPTVVQLIADVLREEGYLVDAVLDSRQGLELARGSAATIWRSAIYGCLILTDAAFTGSWRASKTHSSTG